MFCFLNGFDGLLRKLLRKKNLVLLLLGVVIEEPDISHDRGVGVRGEDGILSSDTLRG
jgi:hypothetical protein